MDAPIAKTTSGLINPKLLTRLGLSVLVALIFILHVAGVVPLRLLTALENQIYDARVRVAMPRTTDPRIVIVDIDDRSLAAEGQWPWSRDKLGQMLDALFDKYGVRQVGFDVVFAEEDRVGGQLKALVGELQEQFPGEQYPALALTLTQKLEAAATDRRFANSLANRQTYLGISFKRGVRRAEVPGVGQLSPPLMSGNELSPLVPIPRPLGHVGNLPMLAGAAAGGGFFDNPLVDEDGVFRRVPLLQLYNSEIYPSLALTMTLAAMGQPPLRFEYGGRGKNAQLQGLVLGNKYIPTDSESAVLVPFRGPQHSFPYVSATDVIRGTAPIDTLFDTIVLVGATAPGLLDHRVTPIANVYAGVEIHANLISGLLDGRFHKHPAWAAIYDTTILLLMGFVLAFGLPRLSVQGGAGLVVFLVFGGILLNMVLWFATRSVLSMAIPIIYVLLCTLVQMTYGFFVEARGRRHLGKMFGQYIPAELVAELDSTNTEISLDGESREMTVMFSDIRNFTTVSETLAPKELSSLMNEFLTPLTRAIHTNRGTIDKYMGDAIMAFWGAPLPDAEHARHAVLAALDMVEVMRHLRTEFAKRGLPALTIGIGINTGPMNVGNMGSEFRTAYTVLGDAVNLGSRLEGLCKQYGVSIIVGEDTMAKVTGIRFRELDRVRVKGKQRPVSIFEPIGAEDRLSSRQRDELVRYEAALVHYRERHWDEAGREFEWLSLRFPEAGLYRSYAGRCAYFQARPPAADWDGVFDHQSK